MRKLPKEYNTSDSDDHVEIVVKKRCHKRPKIKDSTDKGSSSSDYETIFDERGSTSDSDPGKTLIQRCFHEHNRVKQQVHMNILMNIGLMMMTSTSLKEPLKILATSLTILTKIFQRSL